MSTTQFGQTKPVPQGTVWVDCNEHGNPHCWHIDHQVTEYMYVAIWWKCDVCPVTTRTAGNPKWRPKGYLR